MSLLVTYFVYSGVYVSIPISQFPPPPLKLKKSEYMYNHKNLSKLWEIVEDGGVWRAIIHGVTKIQAYLMTEQQQ